MSIKTYRPCRFGELCLACTMADKCLSPTRLVKKKRQFILSLCNKPHYPLEVQELFKKGIENHEKHQIGIKEIEEYGYKQFRKDLRKNKLITLKELRFCSSLYGFHGIIDKIKFHFDKNKVMNIWIDEMKSAYSSRNIIQLTFYAVALTDFKAKVVYKIPYKRKKGEKYIQKILFPQEMKGVNINGRIFYFNQKEKDYWKIVVKNEFQGIFAGIKAGIQAKAKRYREIMMKKVVELESVPMCEPCKNCGWEEICLKIPYNPKSNQNKFGKKKMLIKGRYVR